VTVAVTGATGHLGVHLVRTLLDRGQAVRALVYDAPEVIGGLDVETVAGSTTDGGSLRRLMRDVETVYHLAGVISIDGGLGGRVAAVNVGGTRNAVVAAAEAGVQRFVHVGSIHAFDLSRRQGPIDETSPRVGARHPAYDRSKNDGEREVRRGMDQRLDAVIVNPTGVLGPLDYRPSLMGRSLLDLFHRRLPALIEGGFDWVDVRDVANGVVAAGERGRSGENYILSGRWCSVAEIAAAAAGVTGVAAPRFTVSTRFARRCLPVLRVVGRFSKLPPVTAESLAALDANPDISSAKARAELGFSARPPAVSIADAYACFRERGLIAGAW
jgi:dihydroflavonol-4-reductase